MEAQEDKNKQNDAKGQISALEQEMKSIFKEGNYEALKKAADKLKALDPENRLSEKLMKKAEKAQKKEEKKAKMHKAKEYIVMLKRLHKYKDVEKLTALAKEFKDFDPESKHADKWILRAEKLKEKLSGKKDIPLDEKARTGKATKDDANAKKEVAKEAKVDAEKKPGLLTGLFKKAEKPEKKQGLMQMMAKKAEHIPLDDSSQAGKATKDDTVEKKEPIKIEPKKVEPMKLGVKEEIKKEPVKIKTVQPAPIIAPVPPAAPAKPVAAKAPVTPAAEPAKKVAAKEATPKEEAKPKEAKGNIFTKMFGKKEEEAQKKSIIDTIVAKTDEKKLIKKPM